MDTEYANRPYRVVGSDDVEVALARFHAKANAETLARQMTGLPENWDERNRRCRPPYRVQVMRWEDCDG